MKTDPIYLFPGPYPTATDYFNAFNAVFAEHVPDKHLAILRGHLYAPNRTATWLQLGEKVGWSAKIVNTQYGTFAGRIAKNLGFSEKPGGCWLNVLAGYPYDRAIINGHHAFVLLPPVVKALKRLFPRTDADDSIQAIPEEILTPERFKEGATRQISVNAYERSPAARQSCIDHYGYDCAVCDRSMADLYGKVAESVIHVHHLKDLATIGGEYEVDPIADLRPVCPNCHAVLHTDSPAMSISKLRKILEKRKSK